MMNYDATDISIISTPYRETLLPGARHCIFKGKPMDPTHAYQVIDQQDGFAVVDINNRPVIECKNSINAHHYADLLNKAFYLGYKTGRSERNPNS